MNYNSLELIVDLNTGTTTHDLPDYGEYRELQVAAEAISASGTLTITAVPYGLTTPQKVTNGVINLADSQGITFRGRFASITCTASNEADTYKLAVCG